jgi:hypothetical protein
VVLPARTEENESEEISVKHIQKVFDGTGVTTECGIRVPVKYVNNPNAYREQYIETGGIHGSTCDDCKQAIKEQLQ